MKDKYLNYKTKYKNYLILIKSGVFYITFNEDAGIMNSIFSYQIKNNKVGFPINGLDKVLQKLETLKVNNLIIDEEEKINEYNKNNYLMYFNKVKKDLFQNSLNELLLERIKYILENEENSYQKIIEFIENIGSLSNSGCNPKK